MKKILFKAFEEDGRQFYVYELPEEAQLDEDTLDMCEDGALKGIVPMEYVDDADAFYYDISGYKTISKALRGEVDSSDVLDVMYGITRVLFEFKENGIPLSHLILHKDFIFIDRMTMEVKFLCVPLEEETTSNVIEDVSRFFRVLLSGLIYDINENGSYVTKLFTLLNTPEQFNISILGNALQDLMDEYGVPYEDNLVSGTYGEIDGDYADEDIATIDASALEGMPESVSVAEMEAQAYEDGQEADEYDEEADFAEDAEYETGALAEEEYEETASEYEEDAAYDAQGDTAEDAVYDEESEAAEDTAYDAEADAAGEPDEAAEYDEEADFAGEPAGDAEYEAGALAEEEYEETASEYEEDAAYDAQGDTAEDAVYDEDGEAAEDAAYGAEDDVAGETDEVAEYDEEADAAGETDEAAEYDEEADAAEEPAETAEEYDEEADAAGETDEAAEYDEEADAAGETGEAAEYEDADAAGETDEAAEYDEEADTAEDAAEETDEAADAKPKAEAEEMPDNLFGDDDEFKSVKKVMTKAPKAKDAEKELTEDEIEAQERERRELTRKVVFDEETKRKQQEALRKIAEAGNAKNAPRKQRLVLNRGGMEDIDEALAEIEARKAAEEARKAEEEALGDTAVLKGKQKQHKFGLAKETVVRPVFDSVFEPIIETIDGPMDDLDIPEPYVAVPKPAQNPAKTAKEKAKKEDAASKANVDDEENSDSILSQDVTKASEPSLLSQLDERAEAMPKVNPYLIRVNNGERIMITKSTFKIGKASFGMDYTVTDNGAISRNHCVIIAKEGVYYIRDNKSTNHTYVNGQIVKSGQEVLLTHESTIRIADEDFQFKLR